jgi:hypothetical protein
MNKDKILSLINYLFPIFKIKKKDSSLPDHNLLRKLKVDNESIRARINAQGWKLLEIPIKKNDPNNNKRIVVRWKIVASKGEKSLEVGGSTIDEAMKNIGMALGVINKTNL